MFEKFMPDADFGSVYDISAGLLKEYGVEGVIFDIDDTLVRHGTPLPDEKIREYIRTLTENGIRSALVSNNSDERAKRFAKALRSEGPEGAERSDQTEGFGDAGKPKRSALDSPAASLGTPPEKTVFVGDQLFTDCLCAKRNGIRFFYVEPVDPYENPFFYLKRLLEKPLLKIYKAKKKI